MQVLASTVKIMFAWNSMCDRFLCLSFCRLACLRSTLKCPSPYHWMPSYLSCAALNQTLTSVPSPQTSSETRLSDTTPRARRARLPSNHRVSHTFMSNKSVLFMKFSLDFNLKALTCPLYRC